MKYLVVFFVVVFSFNCFADENNIYNFDDDAKNQEFVTLTKELRCVVCQNQSLHESFAPISVDLKNEIYSKIQEGNNKDEIIQYMTELYGEFILYEPVISSHTLLLWFGPFIFLLAGLALVIRNVRLKR